MHSCILHLSAWLKLVVSFTTRTLYPGGNVPSTRIPCRGGSVSTRRGPAAINLSFWLIKHHVMKMYFEKVEERNENISRPDKWLGSMLEMRAETHAGLNSKWLLFLPHCNQNLEWLVKHYIQQVAAISVDHISTFTLALLNIFNFAQCWSLT
jgi:hypothetical protein